MAPRRSKGPRRYGVGTYGVAADGRHRWRYTTSLASGTTRPIEIRKTDLADLDREVEAFLEQEKRLGYALDLDQRTVAQYCAAWLDERVQLRNESSTRIKYQYDLDRILPFIGTVKVRHLQTEHIQAAVLAMSQLTKADGSLRYSPTTIRRSVEVLRNALNPLVHARRLPDNPVIIKHLDLPKGDDYEPIILEPDDLLRLLDVAEGKWIECLLHVLALTGLRRSEALGLREQDLDFEAKTIRPRQAVKYVGSKIVIGRLKTTASQKPIPMIDEAEHWLMEQRRRVLIMKAARRNVWEDNELVFPATNGKPWSPRNVLRAFKALLGPAGIPQEFRIHDFRHSYASLLSRNYNLRVVQKLLRHADIRSTLRYVHANEPQIREAAETIGTHLSRQRKRR